MKDIYDQNPDELKNETGEEPITQIEEELVALRKKERTENLVFALVMGIIVALGAGFYISNAIAKDVALGNAQQAYYARYTGTASSGGGCGSGGGGGCGGGVSNGCSGGSTASAAGSGVRAGGCCVGGGSGTALTPEALAELEKQCLDLYKEEIRSNDTELKAKAGDYGCHTQIDIIDAQGNIVRSYGYQGSGLYVIR